MMSKSPQDERSLLTEKKGAIGITVLMVILWALGQVNMLAAIVVSAFGAVFLLQLEARRRLALLRFHSFDGDKRALQEQRGIQSLRTAALNSVPSPVILLDRQHRIAAANIAAQSLFNAQLSGDDIILYFRQPGFIRTIRRLLEHGRADRDRATLRYTTTTDRSFEITAAVIEAGRENDKSEARLMLFFFEITSMLKTEQMRVDFVANASHELRTPLSSLMGSIETLQGPARDDPEAQERFLSIMQRESERMVRLIDDLLSLSKIELLRHEAPSDHIAPAMLLRSALNALVNVGKERGITFTLDVAPNIPDVLGDDDQLTQVLMNLLVNAAKYANPNSTVHVSAAVIDTGRNIRFSIRDEGPGIAPEHLARLTERFYRVDTARSRKMGGTGLGLAIVKHILLRHESQLDIKSDVGSGTDFSFRLAVADQVSADQQDTDDMVQDGKSYAPAQPMVEAV